MKQDLQHNRLPALEEELFWFKWLSFNTGFTEACNNAGHFYRSTTCHKTKILMQRYYNISFRIIFIGISLSPGPYQFHKWTDCKKCYNSTSHTYILAIALYILTYLERYFIKYENISVNIGILQLRSNYPVEYGLMVP